MTSTPNLTPVEVSWNEHKKVRPKKYGWYLVAVAGDRHHNPMATIAWWNEGRGYGWSEHADYVGRGRMKVLYWAEMPRLPPPLKRKEL